VFVAAVVLAHLSLSRTCNLSARRRYIEQIRSDALDCDADIGETARGDHLAFGRIVVAHQDRIFAYLGRMGLDSVMAEDVAQETFLRVWRHAGTYNSRLGSLTTWILTIARNAALTRLSQPGRAETPVSAATLEIASDAPLPDEQLVALQRQRRLHAALASLSAADRSLLSASYIDELDLAAVARVEGCSTGATKVRLHRARQRLRQILEADNE
jgi:RNA polymerase sigma-70 factor, ECF subfamily